MPILDHLRETAQIESNGALARRMKASPRWPEGADFTERHIQNMLNKANNGERLQWWRAGKGRPLLPALAEALELSEPDLLQHLSNADGIPEDQGEVFTFDEFPNLRAMDLTTEPLPPFFQEVVPRSWGFLRRRSRQVIWWLAPAGSGRTWLRRWLAAHEQWTSIEQPRWPASLALPADSPGVVLELDSAAGAPRTSEELDALVGEGRSVLVLCPEAPGAQQATSADDPAAAEAGAGDADVDDVWEVVSLDTGLRAPWRWRLLDWVEERLEPDGGLDLERVRASIHAGQLPEEFIQTPGQLLSLLGFLDEEGTSKLLESDELDAERILNRWWRRVCKKLQRQEPDQAAALQRAGWKMVVEAESARMAQARPERLPPEDWAALVPGDSLVGEVSEEQIHTLRSGTPSQKATVLRDLQAASPNELVALLRRSGVLRASSSGRLGLVGGFIGAVLQHAAMLSLFHTRPLGLGALLLQPHQADDAFDLIVEAVEEQAWDELAHLADAATAGSPEGEALLDALVRAVGWWAISAEAAPPLNLVQQLWQRQSALRIERFQHQPALPRLTVVGESTRNPLLARNAWFLGRLGLARVLVRSGAQPPVGADNPWTDRLDDTAERGRLFQGLRAARDALQSGVEDAEEAQATLFKLGRDLYDCQGLLDHQGGFLVDLQGPVGLVECVAGRATLGDRHLTSFCNADPFPLDAILSEARLREVDEAAVLQRCVAVWRDQSWQSCPLFPAVDRRTGEHLQPDAVTQQLWSALDPAFVKDDERFIQALLQTNSCWRFVPDALWELVVDAVRTRWNAYRLREGVVATVPASAWTAALRQIGWKRPMWMPFRRLWAEQPDVMLGHVQWLAAQSTPVGHGFAQTDLYWALVEAPHELSARLVQSVRAWLEAPRTAPGAQPEELRSWLAFLIESRAPAWRDAWRLLAQPT